METDPTQLPVPQEGIDESSEIAPNSLTSIETFSHSENLMNASEGLRRDIETMHGASLELVEHATANPLEETAYEEGDALGLTPEEVSTTLSSGEFTEKDTELRNKAQSLHRGFLAQLSQAAGIGITAFAISTSVPATAETGAPEPPVTLQMAQTLEKQTHESVTERLKNSMTSPTEFLGISVRKDGEEMFTPTAFAKGTGAEASIDGSSIVDAMKSGTTEIEMVHTHPINPDTEHLGGLNEDDKALLGRGGTPNVTVPPSSRDLDALLEVGADKYPASQFTGKVVTPSGDWEYGIQDSGAPYIEGKRKANDEISEMFRSMKFTEEEEAYAKKLETDTGRPGTLAEKITHSDDPIARSIIEKVNSAKSRKSEIIAKHTNPEDVQKFNNFHNFSKAWLRPGTPEGDATIAEREKIANELGFRMKYTPNPVAPKIENLNNDVPLQMSEQIDPTRLDTLGSEYPYIDKHGNELDPPLLTEIPVREQK